MKDVDFLNQVQLITAKPVVYLVNLPEKMYIKKKSKWLPKVCLSVNPLQPWVQECSDCCAPLTLWLAYQA